MTTELPSAEPSAQSSSNPLVGTWRLRTFEIRDREGHVAYPFGKTPLGFITYSADGRMSVQFGSAERPDLQYDDWLGATSAEIETAARAYFAYCGVYEVRGNEVIHRVELSLMPNWIGGEQQRFWSLAGDALTITTPPLRLEGRAQESVLIWDRQPAAVHSSR